MSDLHIHNSRPVFNRQASVQVNTISKIYPRLIRFVQYFVSTFEDKLLQYNSELNGDVEKAGKWAKLAHEGGEAGGALVGAVIAIFVDPTKATAGAKLGKMIGGMTIGGIADYLGKKHHLNRVISLSDLINFTYGYNDIGREAAEKAVIRFREMLVKAALDIFQSYECQLVSLELEQDICKAATEAAHMSIFFFIDKKEFNENLIAMGAILGKPKDRFATNIFDIGKLITNLSLSVHGVYVKYKSKSGDITGEWNIAKLYKEAGIAIPAGEKHAGWYVRVHDSSDSSDSSETEGQEGFIATDGIFDSRKKSIDISKCNTSKYGYRRLLASENWSEMEKDYKGDSFTTKSSALFVNYEYVLDRENIKEISEAVLEQINFNDKNLMENRIVSKLENSEVNILREIRDLKSSIEKLYNGISNPDCIITRL